ncbi:MAG: hypothetical protein KDD11_13385 [Acidobacteria bacterium]|nr:hypothetical protein [Acidobacteriota bacterium]
MSLIRIDKNPSRKNLRIFALLWLAFVGGLAFTVWRRTGDSGWALGLAVVAVVVPLVGELAPEVVRRLYVGLSIAGWPIGWVVSHLLLAVVYFLILTPLGWLLRLLGRTPQEHRPDRSAASYWTPHRPAADPRRYFRQF